MYDSNGRHIKWIFPLKIEKRSDKIAGKSRSFALNGRFLFKVELAEKSEMAI